MPVSAEQAVADAHAVGVTLTPPQAQLLLTHLSLLARWNATYNLTAVQGADAMWQRHTLDCLSAVPRVQAALAGLAGAGRIDGEERAAEAPARAPTRPRLLDVGSGGGLPGVVWAVALPGVDVTCIDAVAKKTAFIRQVAGTLSLPNLTAVHARVERWQAEPFDLITSRAFASLPDFTRWTAHLLKPQGRWVALKGRDPADERVALPAGLSVFHVEHLSLPGLDAERCLVWIEASPRG